MTKINPWLLVLLALAIGGFIWAMDERTKKLLAQEKNNSLTGDHLKLLAEFLNKQNTLPTEIKEQLIHLRENYIGIQDDVAIELKTINELIENNKEEIAIEKLTKVIENLLKEKYIKEGKAKDKRSCPKLFKLLQEALEFKWITKHEYYVSCFLKDKRNDEAHELAIKFPLNWKYIAFLAGIEIIYNLKGIKRK